MQMRGSTLSLFLALYGALFLAFGVIDPFLAAFLHQKGLSLELVGLTLAAGTAIRTLAGPLGGWLADRLRAPQIVLAVCALTAALVVMLYGELAGPSLILVNVASAAALAPLVPLADALTFASAQAERFSYGWIRGAGSATFILGSLMSGQVVALYGLGSIVWMNAPLLALGAVCARRVPDRLQAGTSSGSSKGSVADLLRIPLYRRAMIVAALVQSSHAMHDGFVVINWTRNGAGSATTGLLWSLSVAGEVAMFVFAGRHLVDRLTPAGASVLAAMMSVLRWGLLGLSASVWVGAVAEPLHGFTYALQHLACMRVIGAVVPGRMAATAQAFYNTVAIGAPYALLMLASGWLYARLGGHAFWIMAALCMAAMPIAATLRPLPRPD